MVKMSKLDLFEIDLMSIGMVLDHIQRYADMINPPEETARKATQSDIDLLRA